jgi:hypothetical protein
MQYSKTSPWANTGYTTLGALDTLRIRPIPARADDAQYTIQTQYLHRPDLLAYDLYGTVKLWWVFSQRNMDIIKDPVYDMVPGVTIFIPKKSLLKDALGV